MSHGQGAVRESPPAATPAQVSPHLRPFPMERPAAPEHVQAASPSVDTAAPAKPRYRIGKKKPTVPAAPPRAEPAAEAPPGSEAMTRLAMPASTEHPTSVDVTPPPHALPPPPPAPLGQPPSPATQPPPPAESGRPPRARQGNSLPFGWLEAPRGGGPGCSLHGLVPVKCPLSDRFGLGPAERWTPSDAVEACGGPSLVGLVIDLTNTSRYYSASELPRGVLHLKLPIAGHGVPGEGLVRRFESELGALH